MKYLVGLVLVWGAWGCERTPEEQLRHDVNQYPCHDTVKKVRTEDAVGKCYHKRHSLVILEATATEATVFCECPTGEELECWKNLEKSEKARARAEDDDDGFLLDL